MSKSKAISLKNLALQICGDTSRTNYRVAAVEERLIGYIRSGRLTFWLNGDPYPAISIIDEIFNHDLHGGMPINKRDWCEHVKTNAHLIEIELEELDRFLSDAILKNGVFKAECETAVAQENRKLEEKKILKPNIKQRLPLSFAERHLADAIAEGDFLTHLKTWRNTGAGKTSLEQSRPRPGTKKHSQAQTKDNVITLFERLISEHRGKNNKFFINHPEITPYDLAPKTLERHLAKARKNSKE